MISDAYPIKEVDGVIFEVNCNLVTIKPGAEVDIGANPSAEEAEEGVDEDAITVNDVVHSFRLQPTAFDKKSFLTYMKDYMKRVKAELPADQVEDFQTKASAAFKKIVANFKNYEFYTGESMNPDGMVVLLNYREDGITPYLSFWKHGLKENKL